MPICGAPPLVPRRSATPPTPAAAGQGAGRTPDRRRGGPALVRRGLPPCFQRRRGGRCGGADEPAVHDAVGRTGGRARVRVSPDRSRAPRWAGGGPPPADWADRIGRCGRCGGPPSPVPCAVVCPLPSPPPTSPARSPRSATSTRWTLSGRARAPARQRGPDPDGPGHRARRRRAALGGSGVVAPAAWGDGADDRVSHDPRPVRDRR